MKMPDKRKNKVSKGMRGSAISVAECQATAEAEILRLINDRGRDQGGANLAAQSFISIRENVARNRIPQVALRNCFGRYQLSLQ
jgi:hypothetical protein